MEAIKNYVDLCRKTDIIETQLLQVDIDLKYCWFRRGELPFTGTGADHSGVIASMGNLQDMHDKKHRRLMMLDFFPEIKETEDNINQLEGLDYKLLG